jgi:phospholipase A2
MITKNKYYSRVLFSLCIISTSCFLKSDTLWQRGKKWISNPFAYIKSKEKVILDDPYASTIAHVRSGNDLHQKEREFLVNRRSKIITSLEKILKISLKEKHVPKISIICSGGGYRAMLGSIGAFSGLQAIGLLDSITYVSALSGSTWAVGLWMSTGMTLKQLKAYISKQLTVDFYKIKRPDSHKIAHMLLVKTAFQQPFSTVDLFGAFLAQHLLNDFFGDASQMIHISDQMKNIQDGTFPFPLYSAVDGRINIRGNIPWYEFTPLEVGSAHYGLYVPMWAYGRRFDKGVSIDYAPEQSLGFHFGVFGSAYGGHFKSAWNRVLHNLVSSQAKAIIEKKLLHSRAANMRFAWARVRNFMIGMDTHDSLQQNKLLKLVDAGIEGNLPYIPLSGEREERKQDILIVFDFSQKIPTALKEAEKYARMKNLKFPVVDYTDIHKKTISIFKDDQDREVPVVIYMPRISDYELWKEKKREPRYKKYHDIECFNFDYCIQFGPCYTTNFRYALHQSKEVMDQMEFNVVANEHKIIEAIKWVVNRRK